MRFAAIFVPDFVVQAAMRCLSCNTQNRNQPVAILDGPDSLLRVFACNPAAQVAGVEIGMTKVTESVWLIDRVSMKLNISKLHIFKSSSATLSTYTHYQPNAVALDELLSEAKAD